LESHPHVLEGADAGQPERLRTLLTPETTYWQYTTGVKNRSLVSPDGYNLDNYYMTRPGAHEVQLDLFLDYATNVDMYPKFQEYFRQRQPPLLAVWGNGDPFFVPAGAEAFKRDIKKREGYVLRYGTLCSGDALR
jgi:hypothetical protein